MSESTAAPQHEPENIGAMTLSEVEAALVEMEGRFIRLYQQYIALEGNGLEDKRKTFNPARNLKISANRSYQWARRAGCTADEARERAIVATIESAKVQEKEHMLGKLLLRLSKKLPTPSTDVTLPVDVTSYIELKHSEYNMTEAEKKAKRSKKAKKSKSTSI